MLKKNKKIKYKYKSIIIHYFGSPTMELNSLYDKGYIFVSTERTSNDATLVTVKKEV